MVKSVDFLSSLDILPEEASVNSNETKKMAVNNKIRYPKPLWASKIIFAVSIIKI